MFTEVIQKLLSGTASGILDGIDKIIDNFVQSPEQKAEWLKAREQFMAQLIEADVKDRDSARKREAETKDPTTHRLAYLYTGGYFGLVVLVWHYGVPATIHDVFLALLSIMTAAQGAIVNYYFGSSHSSSRKDELIQVVMKNGHK